MKEITLIAHNLRSCHNVGSLLRTADGMGIKSVYLTGHTPYPAKPNDQRLPHERDKLNRQIHKTALGAEDSVDWHFEADVTKVITSLKNEGFKIIALEQAPGAIPLPEYKAPSKVALIVGREVEGIEPEVLDLCDQALVIPMLGQKESYNVVQAAAMALYHLRFSPYKQ